MEGILDRRGGRIFTDRLQSRSRLTRRICASRKRGEGHGKATGMSEVRWRRECAEETPRKRKPEVARRSGSDVLNRQVPQSPPSGVQAQDEGAKRKL